MRQPCQLIVAFAAILLLVAPAAADIVPPGKSKVRRDAIVDFGPYADYSTWTYVVKKGDTISEIAERHLGTLKRQGEITKLNPGLTAETLKTDRKILMPPRKTPRPIDPAEAKGLKLPADAQIWWDFYGARWNGFGQIERTAHGDKIPHHHYWTTLCAVRHDKVGEFEKALADAGPKNTDQALKALVKQPWVAVAETHLTGYATIAQSSPIRSIVEHYKLESIADGKIHLKHVRTDNFDKDREPVTGTGLFGGSFNLLLLFLAFAGMLGLVIVVSRRRAPGRINIPVGS